MNASSRRLLMRCALLVCFCSCSSYVPNTRGQADGQGGGGGISAGGSDAGSAGGVDENGGSSGDGTSPASGGTAGGTSSPSDGGNTAGITSPASGGSGGSAVGGSTGSAGATNTAGSSSVEPRWVGTWACGPQLTETNNLPPSPGLASNTLRQVVYTSIGGSRIRLRLSNEFGNGPVTFNSVHIAVSTQGSSVDAATDKTLAFSGSPSVTVPSGKAVFSDPLDFALNPLTKIAISTYFGAVPSNITGHPGSRTTSYILAGDVASNSTMSSPVTTDHWYYITGIDVVADPPAAAIVILGDSITDGRGSTTNGNDRWPDALSRRLRANTATAQVAVLNQGIGGNGVFGGLGPSAVARYSRDVLGQRGAKWVIVLEGVNDIGGASNESLAANLISAYESFINQAHLAGFKIYGVPILPIGGSSYYSELHENIRQTVNTWIRTSGKFDAVIDLDSAVRDATDPSKLAAAYDSGDHLHLSPTGYQKMADAVDLTLFNQ